MFDVIFKKVTDVVEDNKVTILTGIGVAGTVTTAVLSGRAGFKAARLIDNKRVESVTWTEDDVEVDPLTTKDLIFLVGPQFIPAVGMGALTVSAIIFANRLSAKETAAMAAMYSMSDKTFQEYKEKVQEKLGQNKETALRDEIAQDRVDANPVDNRTVIITGGGDVLCYDILTDRYFNSTVEKIKQAQNEINAEILNQDMVSLGQFYERIGLQVTAYSDSVGWNLDNLCEVEFSATTSSDNRPCMAIDFKRYPKPDYDRVHGFGE